MAATPRHSFLLMEPVALPNKERRLFSRWKPHQIVFTVWAFLALLMLLPVSQLLHGSFPIFTVVWIVVPLVAVWRMKDPGMVGFRSVPWRQLVQITAINLGLLLALMLLFEPWSHTYQKLLTLALSSPAPDTNLRVAAAVSTHSGAL
jgi:hypothetical protein